MVANSTNIEFALKRVNRKEIRICMGWGEVNIITLYFVHTVLDAQTL